MSSVSGAAIVNVLQSTVSSIRDTLLPGISSEKFPVVNGGESVQRLASAASSHVSHEMGQASPIDRVGSISSPCRSGRSPKTDLHSPYVASMAPDSWCRASTTHACVGPSSKQLLGQDKHDT